MKQPVRLFGHGQKVVFDSPPSVKPAMGMLPFSAPSNRGTIYENVPGQVFVRFRYKNATGGISWSDALELSNPDTEATEDTES